MTLLLIDGFDYINSDDLSRRYSHSGITIDTSNQRTGQGCLQFSANGSSLVWNNPSSETEYVIGFALWYYDTGTSGYLLRLRADDGNEQMYLTLNSGGEISLTSAFGTVASTEQVSTLGYVYVEFKFLIHNSAGTYELRVNGNTWLSGSGVDTQWRADDSLGSFQFYQNQNSKYYRIDDLYFLDTAGAVNNDFLGDCKVETLLPSGAGNYSSWTPSAGANYENVDDTSPDDDSTYNSAGGSVKDSYAMGNLSMASGTIFGVQVNSIVRKDDAGTARARNFLRQGGSDYPETSFGLGDTYSHLTEIEETDPDTGSAWTISGVNSVEAGIERTA